MKKIGVNTEQIEAIIYQLKDKTVAVTVPVTCTFAVKLTIVGILNIMEDINYEEQTYFYVTPKNLQNSISFSVNDIEKIMPDSPTNVPIIFLKSDE